MQNEYPHRCDCPKCGAKGLATHHAWTNFAADVITCPTCTFVWHEGEIDERADKAKPPCNVCARKVRHVNP